MKKFLSLLLAAMMIFSVLPTAALADGMKTLDMAPVGEVTSPAEQPAEQEQPAAPAEEPAEEPAAEENEAPVLRAPAAAGAAVPAPSATNGFVEEIYFPVSNSKSAGANLERIQGFTFDKNTASYDNVVLPDNAATITGSVWFGMSIPAERKGELYYFVYYNGVAQNRAPSLMRSATMKIFSSAYLKTLEVGEWATMSVQVGTVDETKKNFTAFDVYEFHITRQASLNKISVSANGENLALIPSPDFLNSPYVRDFVAISAAESVTLNVSGSKGAKIYVGNNEITDGTDVEVNIADYRVNDELAKIPITVKHDSGEAKTEATYYVNISNSDHTPVIVEQPHNTASEKNESIPLTVSVKEDSKAVTSYQWYDATNRLYPVKIDGATEASYQPTLKYAGSKAYYCIITNTVDGVQYTVQSETAQYETKLTYLTMPESYYLTCTNGDTFYQNGRPLIEARVYESTDNSKNDVTDKNKKISAAIYRTDKNESEGGVLVTEINATHKSVGAYNAYEAMLPPQSVLGTYYYYAVINYSVEGYDSVSGTTEPIAITFTEISGLVTGLEGSGSAADPFLVHNQEELEYVKAMVEGKNGEPYDFAGQTIAFANDISVSADWEPIGGLKEGGKEGDQGKSLLPFAGIIDGHGYTFIIADHGKCLLKYARNAAVKNLKIKGEHIDGYGLLDKYVVDYGSDGSYSGQYAAKSKVIDIENVTIKSGTKVLRSGFLGGYASGANNVSIRNCVVEQGVTIGDDGTWGDLGDTTEPYPFVGVFIHKDNIGSFAGAFNGTIKNCVSYATVYGRNNVGGLIGMKGQSMGSCDVSNSAFIGKIISSGNTVGGIVGSGYNAKSAPGSPMIQVHNCYVAAEISGEDKVGGIVGAESGHKNNVDEGDVYGVKGVVSVSETHFYGTVSAKGGYVGGIVGYFNDFTKKTGEASNFFVSTCGTDRAIGGVAEGNTVVGEELYGLAFSEEDFANGTVNAKLNASESPYKEMLNYAEWIQAAKYPVLDGTAPAVEAKIAAIGTVTKDSGEAIKDARSSYEALTPEQKALVTKEALDALVKAEKMFDMIIASNKPAASGKEESTGSVIHIAANGAAKGEQNPNTGAPAMSIAPAMLVLAAAAFMLKKRG